jgi:hypothetical protein
LVPIQFQELVRCIAYGLYVLGALRRNWDAMLADGVRVTAKSEPYVPPNPEEAYARVVGGRCDFQLTLGAVAVKGVTNFKRGARWKKRRALRGSLFN